MNLAEERATTVTPLARSTVRYAIVSPVRDEEQFIERTLESVLRQTILPVRWVIVDDASVDRTPEILSRYRNNPLITVLRRERGGGRQPGTGVILAFNAGYEVLNDVQFDYVVKLDCDVILPPDYFKTLFTKFDLDPFLGIASGLYLEEKKGQWCPVEMPPYHAAGASKVIRRTCFQQIGGFVAMRGWDTVDEIKAQVMNWRTSHFPEIQFWHLKPEGSAIGWCGFQLLHGEEYYRYRGSRVFFFFKVAHRTLTARPMVLAGMAMLWGYLRSYLLRLPKLITPAEGRLYRRMQYSRFLAKYKNALTRSSKTDPVSAGG